MAENGTFLPASTELEPPKAATLEELWELLTLPQQVFVDYRASGGMRFGLDAVPTRLTVDAFADEIGIPTRTLYNWEKAINGFADLKSWRRRQIYSNRVVDSAWRASAAAATKGNSTEIERILTNFDPNYKSPKVRAELDAGEGLIELFDIMRREAKVIDGTATEIEPGTIEVAGEERAADI